MHKMKFSPAFVSKSKYILAMLIGIICLTACTKEELSVLSTEMYEVCEETIGDETMSETWGELPEVSAEQTEVSAELPEVSVDQTAESVELSETVMETEASSETEEMLPSEPVIEPVVAEPPSFLNIEEVTVTLPGLSRNYTFAWISDLHIIADCYNLEERPDVHPLHYDKVRSRYESFKTADGIHSVDLWDDIVNWLNTQELDGVLLGGDLLDYYSEANMQAFKKEYDRMEAPAMYIRADHDYGIWYSENAGYASNALEGHRAVDDDRWGSKYLDYGEFVIVGINNSQQSLPEEAWDDVSDQISSGKSMILVTHVPFASDVDTSLYDLSMAVRGKEYYWPSDIYQPKDAQPLLMEAINQPDTLFEQVLAGHLHASWDGMINNKVPEHIFGPAYAGNIGIINVVSK